MAKGLRAPNTALALAREDPARARAVRDGRVDEIVTLMCHGRWEGLLTTSELAAQWSVSRQIVSEYAREASSIIRHLSEGAKEDIKAEILAGIERLRIIADRHGRVDVRGVKVALDAYDMRMRALGLYPAQRLEIVTQEAWESLSVAEKRERLERAKARIAILEAQLPPIPNAVDSK